MAARAEATTTAPGAPGAAAASLPALPALARLTRARTGALDLPAAAVLAAAGGAAWGAGFPPLAWAPAPWLALVPLLIACARLSPARAAVAGLVWTAAAAAIVARFLPDMLSAYFGLAPAWSWLATLAAAGLLHGAPIAGFAAWVAWLARRRTAHPLLVACGWVACEWARAHGELGSPWGLAAYSQVRHPLLVQSADLAGAYGIGFVMAAVNASVAAWLEPRLCAGPARARASVATLALLAVVAAYGASRLQAEFADGPPVRVRLVQGGAPERDPSLRAARLARHVALSAAVDDRGARHAAAADVIVWPESAVDEYLQEPSSARAAVLELARATRADVILGGPHHERAPDGTRYHNSAFLVRDGDVVARYDKQRLVPFAEDGRGVAAGSGTASHYTAGTGRRTVPARGLRAGVLLCFEAMFPDLARAATHDGADVLLNLSNDGWFGRAEAAQLQLDIATLRAVESRRFLVRAAATGISAVIDPHGRTLARSAFDTTESLDAVVHASHASTLYQRRGDVPAWLLIAAALLVSLRAAIRSEPTTDERKIR